LRQLTEYRGPGQTSAVIVSAKDAPPGRVERISCCSGHYLVKPFLPLQLVARVKAFFQHAAQSEEYCGAPLRF